jgi:hypothetical protein
MEALLSLLGSDQVDKREGAAPDHGAGASSRPIAMDPHEPQEVVGDDLRVS